MSNEKHWAWLWRPLLVVVLSALIWWLLPPVLYGHTEATADARLKAITDTRTALLAGLVGVGALLTFWLNSRVYRITALTLRVTEQGQITERYTKAIEQLGSDKLDVRLGGIYALERIAKDSDRDHPTVVEVLGAFVREHSQPATQPSPGTAADAKGDSAIPLLRLGPPTDVQAACTVLGRLPQRSNVSRGDLLGAYLEGVDLGGAHLEGMIVAKAHLEEAYLKDAYLAEANLYEAHLEGARLQGAHLERAILVEAHMEGTDLRGAHLEGAHLNDAHLKSADLSAAHLEEAYLMGADLEGAVADKVTSWPVDFDWEAAGVVTKPPSAKPAGT